MGRSARTSLATMAALVAAALAGCGVVLGVGDISLVPADAGSGGADGSSASASSTVASGAASSGSAGGDAGCSGLVCKPVVIASAPWVYAVAVEPGPTGRVFFLSGASAMRVDKDGTGQTVLATANYRTFRLALSAERVYFTVFDGTVKTTVESVAKDGSDHRQDSATYFGPERLAVDGSGIYFTNRYDQTLLVATPLDGGVSTNLFGVSDPEPVLLSPGGVGLDDGYVYWTIGTYQGADGGVIGGLYRTSKATKATERFAAPIEGGAIGPFAVAVDGDRVYWGEDGRLRSMAKSGGTIVDVAKTGGGIVDIAFDEQNVYWVVQGTGIHDGQVLRVRKDGSGSPEVLAIGLDFPDGIAVDETRVYFTDEKPGQVLAVPK